MQPEALSKSVEQHVCQRFVDATRQEHPFPHIYVRDIFPADYYRELQRSLSASEHFRPIKETRGVRGYPDRFLQMLTPASETDALPEPARSFLAELGRWLTSGAFGHAVLAKFEDIVTPRVPQSDDLYITDEAMVVYDRTNYSLGPHTDSWRKLVSVLFYLPADDRLERYGTSMYAPKDPAFRCSGGPHHPFDKFERAATLPFLPNSLFAFAKTDRSFHGVEPITEAGVGRHLLLYDLHLKEGQPDAGGGNSAV